MQRKAVGTVTCEQCGKVDDSGSKFCRQCGSPLDLACPGCGTHQRAGKRFCTKCGTDLRISPKKQTTPKKQPPVKDQPTEVPLHDSPESSGFGSLIGRSIVSYVKRLIWAFVGSLLAGSAVGSLLSFFSGLNPELVSWITIGVSFIAALRFGMAGFGAAIRRSLPT